MPCGTKSVISRSIFELHRPNFSVSFSEVLSTITMHKESNKRCVHFLFANIFQNFEKIENIYIYFKIGFFGQILKINV